MSDNPGARHAFLRRWTPPEEWQQAQLGSLATVVGGGTPSRDDGRYWGGDIPWATPSDITANVGKYLHRTAEAITNAGLRGSAATLLPAESVLYTSRATIGAKAIAAVPTATNQGFASFVPHELESDYLYYLLDLLKPAITRLAAGTTFLEVSKRDIRKVWCAFPPRKADRDTIVAVLDAATVLIARSRDALDQAQVVKRALTQQLLSRGIRDEPLKKTEIGYMPRSWEVATVRAIVSRFQYGLSVPMETCGDVPILRMGNVQHGDIELADLKYVSLPVEVLAPYALERGDVLFNRTNSQQWVGKVGIYRHDAQAVFASYLIRLVPDRAEVDPFYLGHVLNSYQAQCRIRRYATPGVQQVNINATNLGKVLVPLPPGDAGLREQREIASLLEDAHGVVAVHTTLLAAYDRLERSLTEALLSGKLAVASVAPLLETTV